MGSAEEEVENGGEKHRLCGRRCALMTLLTAVLPIRRRLRLDPRSKLYFPYEPGKQVRSAVKLINTSRSNVAFKEFSAGSRKFCKFQTTAPKSCFMRPPTGMLAPGESVIATVFKFVEPPEETKENNLDGKSSTKDKFKIVSLIVESRERFSKDMFEEQRDAIIVEQILKVIFLDPNTPCSALEKLNKQLAEAEAQAPNKPPSPGSKGDSLPSNHKGPAIDQWKERRRRYIAEHQGETETTKQPSSSSEL